MSEESMVESYEISTPAIDAETSALVATAVAGNPQVRTVTTLGDGTILEIIPYDDTKPSDRNLHEAARLILEYAEPNMITEEQQQEIVVQQGASVAHGTDGGQVYVLETEDDNSLSLSENGPTRIIRSSNEPRKGFCTGCQKIVDYKNRRRHLLLVHQISQANEAAMTKCIHPDCDREFYMVKSMMKHLETDHAVQVETKELTFSTWHDFLQWKSVEEDTNFVFFSKRSGECVRAGRILSYYVCQRDGSQKPHKKKGYIHSGRSTKKGRVRQDLTCPARIKAYRSEEGVKVVYTFSHNHPITPYDTIHQPLSKNKIAKIRQQLEKGVNSDRIHANLSSVKVDAFREPSHIVTKRRIDNIKKKLDKENRLSNEEPASVHMLVTRLQQQAHSPILLYVCEFIYDNDGHVYATHIYDPAKLFVVLYQSQKQYEIMAKYASRTLIIDGDGSTDNNENQLLNLLVSDEFHRAYPVAHIITNDLQRGLRMSLEKVKERLPENYDLSVVFTPNEAVFHLVLNSVFESATEVKFFSGRWETIRQWEKKIKMTIFSSTIRRELSQMLCMILDESDPNRFEILLEVFLKEFSPKADRFMRFFEKNYAYAKGGWAKCHTDFEQCGTDRAEYMRKLTSRLDWWIGERPSNKRIDDLINLLTRIDEEWSTQRQSDLETYGHLVDTDLSKHLLSTMSPDDKIHPVKLNDGSIRIWFVKGDDQNAAFVVKLVQESCEFDFCWDRCLEESCAGLCAHMYTCSCDDGTGLCEHIHQVRSFCHRGDGPEEQQPDVQSVIMGTNVHTLLTMGDFDLSEGMEVVIVDENDLVPGTHYVQISSENVLSNELAVENAIETHDGELLFVEEPGTSSEILIATDDDC